MKKEMKDLFIEYFSKINTDNNGNVTNYDEILSQEFMSKLLKIESNIESLKQEVEHLSKDEDANRILFDEIKEPIKVDVKTRYSSKVAKATILQNGDYIKIEFDEPQRALTPGQSAVFYIDDIVVGGGKIL